MEIIKKYWYYVVIIGFVISTTYTCTNNKEHELRGEVEQLNKQLEKSTKGLEQFRVRQKTLFDSISSAEKIKNQKIAELKNSNSSLEKKLQISQEKLKQRKESFRNKTYQQLLEVFKEMGYTSVTANSNGINLEKDTPMEVLDDLAEGENCAQDLKIKDSIIKNKDSEISLVNEKVLNRDIQLASKQIEVGKLDESLQISREINKKQEKENKQLRKKNFITTYLVPPLVFIAGFLIGK